MTPDKIIELWPRLSEEDRKVLIETAEMRAARTPAMQLTPEELTGIERGRADFAAGRTKLLEEYRADMDSFFARLRAKQTTPT